MIMFKKTKETSAPKVYKPTHKKKNTYIVQLSNVLASFNAFAACQETPLPVIILNGEQIQKPGDWMASKQFPNPCATKMAHDFKYCKPIMGEKIASTIVEYLDKETNEPAVTLFPQNQTYFHKSGISDIIKVTKQGENINIWFARGAEIDLARLNHASRQDFINQVLLRNNLLQKQ